MYMYIYIYIYIDPVDLHQLQRQSPDPPLQKAKRAGRRSSNGKIMQIACLPCRHDGAADSGWIRRQSPATGAQEPSLVPQGQAAKAIDSRMEKVEGWQRSQATDDHSILEPRESFAAARRKQRVPLGGNGGQMARKESHAPVVGTIGGASIPLGRSNNEFLPALLMPVVFAAGHSEDAVHASGCHILHPLGSPNRLKDMAASV